MVDSIQVAKARREEAFGCSFEGFRSEARVPKAVDSLQVAKARRQKDEKMERQVRNEISRSKLHERPSFPSIFMQFSCSFHAVFI